jgi:hypothetical protein
MIFGLGQAAEQVSDFNGGDTFARSGIATDSYCLAIRSATGRPTLPLIHPLLRRRWFRSADLAMTARHEFFGAEAILQSNLIERGYLEELFRRRVEALLDESLDPLVDARR